MNNQEAFNKMWDHFVTKKNPPGYNPKFASCEYIADDGSKCAVGCLLSEEDLNLFRIGDLDQSDPIDCLIDYLPSLGEVDLDLLETAQAVHDRAAGKMRSENQNFTLLMQSGLADLAETFELEIEL